ncbi:hypothetical protein [uncultured Muribaculum sp.]|uniref:hypothetical protein n=1 Tax=uncultured Muribaculum sp. TaxID=1918613 RepID=UPI0026760427|nr:hypothetical protein [uncultured Muribaculum sp.]
MSRGIRGSDCLRRWYRATLDNAVHEIADIFGMVEFHCKVNYGASFCDSEIIPSVLIKLHFERWCVFLSQR